MSKYLVTGAAGFIGSEVVYQLLNNNHVVIGVDSFNEILYPNVYREKRIGRLLEKQNFSLIKENLMSINLDLLLEGVDHVINLAGLPGQLKSWDRIPEYFESNTFSAFKLYDACLRNGVDTFVQASTSSVYGLNAIGDEKSALHPASPYGVSKLATEKLINALSVNSKIKTIILRYFSVYGPGQRPDMGIFNFIQAIISKHKINIYGDGEQTRDLTFVIDAARATILAIENGIDGGVYNISGGEQISLNNLLKILEKISKSETIINYVERPRGDQVNTLADTSKARGELKWTPQVTLQQGLHEQYIWQKNLT
jgi:UDP-glucuronate 4-epimerase